MSATRRLKAVRRILLGHWTGPNKKSQAARSEEHTSEIPSRLRELAEADKDGRVVVLPCKVGDVLYAAESAPVIPLHVMEVAIYLALEGEDGGDYERISNIGKTVFLTRAEAEKALQQMEGETGIENSKSYPEKDEPDGTLRQ